MEFMEVALALDEIASYGSTLTKQQLLKRHAANIPGFKEVLRYIYDPYFTTGLKQAKLDSVSCDVNLLDGVGRQQAEIVMEYLKHHNTGTLADCIVAAAFVYQEEDPTWQWAATGLVTKDLQIGVSVTTLNNVFGRAFIPKIGIMRGMLCPEDYTGWTIATEKIDGNRRLIFTHPDGVRAFTRSGKPDFGLVEILEEAKQLPVGYVFDCECVAIGDFADNIALRQASASILNRGSKSQKTGVKALCFDIIPIEEYNRKRSFSNAVARKAALAKIFGDTESVDKLLHEFPSWAVPLEQYISAFKSVSLEHITSLPIIGFPRSYTEAKEMAKPIWETGGEGLMLVDYRSAYEVNPNPRKTLLKIKATLEYELKCIGVYEGTGKYAGMLGGVYVAYHHGGSVYRVGVGSGFTDAERYDYWQHNDKIVGHVVEIDSFGESVNAEGSYSLNCPIFKRVKGRA